MIKYIPFLKSKSNEIIAIGELEPHVLDAICPFFDYPKKNGGYSPLAFQSAVKKTIKSIKSNIDNLGEFYFDNYDIEDTLTIGTDHNYKFLLQSLSGLHVIPVISIDRSTAHLQAVSDLKSTGVITSGYIAARFTSEYFENFAAIEADIESDLVPIFNKFSAIDLILDCRVCKKVDVNTISLKIQNFSLNFASKYNVRRVIVTGSSLSAVSSENLKAGTSILVKRVELEIHSKVAENHTHAPLIIGDYTVVSPNYSDVNIPPEMMQLVMTPKLTYTFNNHHYLIRGGVLQRNRSQYFSMAHSICTQTFFRGSGYSMGDAYLEEKSRGQGGNCAPNSVIKPSVNAHVTYMALDYPA